jgi:RNA polymerase sigma factor (sigma-70 family)
MTPLLTTESFRQTDADLDGAADVPVLRTRQETEALYRDNEPSAMAAVNACMRSYPNLRRRLLRRMERQDVDALGRMAMWRACVAFDPDKGRLSSLVYTVVRHTLIAEAVRRQVEALSLQAIGSPDDAEWQPPSPNDGAAEDNDLRAEVEHLLADLPRRHQIVLTLYYGLRGCQPHGMRDIAALMSISRSRVGQVIKKALAKLRPARAGHEQALPVA